MFERTQATQEHDHRHLAIGQRSNGARHDISHCPDGFVIGEKIAQRGHTARLVEGVEQRFDALRVGQACVLEGCSDVLLPCRLSRDATLRQRTYH